MTDISSDIPETANGFDRAAGGNGADSAAERARGRMAEAAGVLEARYRELAEEAEKLVATARREATKRYGELQERVKSQPEVGVGLGFVAGLIVAMMLSGNRTIVVRDGRHHF